MTLKQGFTIWACAPRNTVLAAKSREAVQKVLMKKWSDLDLEVITPMMAERIFRESPESQELKVKAASILVYILQWGCDNGHCQRPTFDYTIANAKPKTDPLAGIDFDDKKQVADALMEQSARIMNDKPKEETNMSNEKKPRGKAPKPVAQLDPETLKVVKVWPSRCEAERQTGACNIDRCIAKHRMSAGYYWCSPEEADTFKPSPLSGNQPTKHNKKETSSASDIVAKNEQFKEDMKELMPDAVPASVALAKFKIGDHVWAKQPKELYGRTGYVISVDTYRMMYDVKYGAELWNVREDDLELVNEPVMAEYITKKKLESLAEYTNDELIAEMKRRGWKGNVTMTVSVDL